MTFKSGISEHTAEIPVRAALYSRIGGVVTCRVFNGNAPENTKFPYVVLGESTENEFSTKLSNGSEMTLTVHIFTEEDGYDQIDGLKQEVLTALSGSPLYMGANWSLVTLGMDNSRKYRYDAEHAHCIVYFRFRMNYN